jgi:hypothetical protein
MPSTETKAIQLKDKDGQVTTGELQTTLYDSGDRMKRALLRLAASWAAAGVTLFIPLAHFVLVPGFLIAGPVLAVAAYRMQWARDHASGQCPVCKADIKIDLDAKENLPKWTYCPACNASLHLAETT